MLNLISEVFMPQCSLKYYFCKDSFIALIVVGLTSRAEKFIATTFKQNHKFQMKKKVSRLLTGGISAFHAHKSQYKYNPGLQMQNLSTENPLVLLLQLGDTILPLNSALKWQSLMTKPNCMFSVPFCLFSTTEEPRQTEIELLSLIQCVFQCNFSHPCPAILEKCFGFSEAVAVIERGGKIQHLFVDLNLLSAYSSTPVKKKNQMNALTHFPFPLPPPGPFCPYISVKQHYSKSRKTAH